MIIKLGRIKNGHIIFTIHHIFISYIRSRISFDHIFISFHDNYMIKWDHKMIIY